MSDNSFHSKKLIMQDSDDKELNKSTFMLKKEMITFKKIQNLDITIYNYIFLDRRILPNIAVQDFESFTDILKEIKNKFNSKILKNNNVEVFIKNEGKFSFNNSNLTELIPFNKKDMKKIEISINSRYLNTYGIKNKIINLYSSKCFFKGKYCFEIQTLSRITPKVGIGLINISYIETFKQILKNKKDLNIDDDISEINMEYLSRFILKQTLFLKKNNNAYNRSISYGDIFGICYDLEQKLLLLFLNGELINTYTLKVEIGANIAFSPFISLGQSTEITFNPGENLKYKNNYKKYGFIPLDEKGQNNYELSKLKEVTDEYIDILINKGKSIINNKNISYTDINQIYHIIFDFLGNISFQHSHIVQNSFFGGFLNLLFDKKGFNINDEFENFYLCLKYIINAAKDRKTIIKNIFFNLSENIHIYLRYGEIQYLLMIQNLIKFFTFLISKKDIIDIVIKMPKTLRKIFKSIFISCHICEDISIKIDSFYIIIKTNFNNDNSDNNIIKDKDLFSPYIVVSSKKLEKSINCTDILSNNNVNIISNFHKELIILLFKNGMDIQNKNIYNIFNNFLDKEISNI